MVAWPPLFCPLQAIEKLVALLNTLDRWIDETPPVDQPSRFGNKAYRTWYAKLDEVRLPQCRLGGWAGAVGDFGHLGLPGEFVKMAIPFAKSTNAFTLYPSHLPGLSPVDVRALARRCHLGQCLR